MDLFLQICRNLGYNCNMSEDKLAATLRKHKQSVTTARRAVFTTLQGHEPLTMQQVVTKTPTIDRASVYRAVALFERLGIVQRLQTGWKYRLELSDAFHEHHHHASCLSCGTVLSLPEDIQLEELLQQTAASYHFTLQTHQLELQGYCESCANTETTAKG
jgi:Fe2+ or Zn2+ uptake regulation protein